MTGWWLLLWSIGSLATSVAILIARGPTRSIQRIMRDARSLRVREPGEAICLVCRSSLSNAMFVQVCPRRSCGAAYHRECWAYNRRCARYGCVTARAA